MTPADPNDRALLVFLALLGVLLTARLLRRYPRRRRAALRDLAIWVLIILGLTLAYCVGT